MVVLKAKQSFLKMQYIVLSRRPRCTCTQLDTGGPTDFLNCDNSGTQDEKLEIMIIRNCLPCTLPL